MNSRNSIRIESNKDLEYLDLALKEGSKKKRTIEGHTIGCNFNGKYTHLLHGENRKHNTLVDLIINFNIEVKRQFDLKNKLKELIEKTNYIKKSNSFSERRIIFLEEKIIEK